MHVSRLRYIFTWVSLIVMMICITLLAANAWNSQFMGTISQSLLISLWLGSSTSGIYLFLLAVKKAHRQWINEMRQLEKEASEVDEKSSAKSSASMEKKGLDYASAARKIVRRIPENIAHDQLGKLLLKNLSRELELMSGIFYLEQNGTYIMDASYAMVSGTEPFKFKAGEGLSGQVARDKQVLVLNRMPEGLLEVYSGLGKAAPAYLAIIPLVHKGKTIAVLECSGYKYEQGDIENMFRIFARDLMDKLSPNFS